MRIDKIFINGFGQLTDRNFDFSDGINVIYGENEKGKSTMHNFMENMLYHPFKSNKKKRSKSGIMAKYKPWGKSVYSGKMDIFDEEKISIEKDFSTNDSQINVFDKDAKDISASYELDSYSKELKIGYKHLGLSKVMFKNTVSVGQLDKSTDSDIEPEIKQYISNMESAKDSTISVDAVKARISAELDEIGNAKRHTSKYGIRNKKIKDLKVELEQAMEVASEIDDLQIKSVELRTKKEAINDRIQTLNKKLADIEKAEINQIKEKADKIVLELNDSKKELGHLKRYENFTYATINELGNIRTDIEKAELAKANTKKNVARLDIEKAELDVDEDIAAANIYELMDEKKGLREAQSAIKMSELKSKELQDELDDMLAKVGDLDEVKAPNKYIYIGIALASILIGIGLMKLSTLVGIIVIILGLGISFFIWYKEKNNYSIYRLRKSREDEDIEDIMQAIEDGRRSVSQILAKWECENVDDLERKFENTEAEIMKLNIKAKEKSRNREKLGAINAELRSNNDDLAELDDKLASLYARRDELFAKLEISSFDSVEEGYSKNQRYDDVSKTIEHLEELLAEALGNKKYDELKFSQISSLVNIDDKERLSAKREELNEEYQAVDKEESKYLEQISVLERRGRTVQSYEEEIEGLQAAKLVDDRRIAVLKALSDKLNETLETMQRTVMPEVNKTIADIVSAVTDGKYDDIKVNKDLEVYVLDNKNKKTVKLDALSAGTIDLLYVGLRIGMAALFNSNKPVPIFFDDTFAQIDDKRLKNLLAYLAGLGRQIFIFTCHEREASLLKELGVEHNLIRL